MALIKTTAFLDSISGKVQGSVFARNKGGAIVRGRGTVSNPQTALQQSVRGSFSGIAALFKTLTTAQAEAWDNLAQNFPYRNRLGDERIYSGRAFFQKLNMGLATVGLPANRTIPRIEGLPEIFGRAGDATAEVENNELTIAVSGTVTSNPQALDDFMTVVYATPQHSQAKKNVKNQYRVLGYAETTAGVLPATLEGGQTVGEAYVAKFGLPEEGMKINIGVKFVEVQSGRMSEMYAYGAIVNL